MASVNINLTRWLSNISVDTKEMLESIIKKALTRSCVRIANYARTHHRSWKDRSSALAKAITYRFIHKLTAEVYISEEKLRKERSEADKHALNSKAKYKEGQDVGKGSYFPLNPFKNYGDYLIEGTHAHSSKHAKALRFVGKDGKIHFVRSPNKVKGIQGNDWLANARKRVGLGKVVREVLDEYGIKHD